MDKIYVWVKRRKLKPKRGVKQGCSYMVQWQDPKTGQVKSESCGKDKALAYRLAAERRDELQTGQYRGINIISYDDFVVEHLGQLKGTQSESSYTEHELVLRQFKKACNPKNLTVIDFQMLEKFRKSRIDAEVSPATINKGLRVLRAAFQKAVKRGYIKANPFEGHRQALWVSEPEPVPNILEPEEFEALLAACQDDRWRAICMIGYYAGLRRAEIVHLEWTDVDFDNEILYVRNKTKAGHTTKSKKNRQVPMSSQVVSALQVLQRSIFQSKHVFRNTAGRPMYNNFGSCFERIVRRAGLVENIQVDDKIVENPRFSVHDLRRSCATELLRQGVQPNPDISWI